MSPTPATARGPRRTARRTGLRLAFATAGLALLTSGCDGRKLYEESFSFGLPDPVTDQGQRVYDLWLGTVVAGAVVALLVWGLIFIAVVAYRKRSDELPRQVRYNLPVEVLYTVVPFIVIAVLFFYTARDETYLDKTTAKPDVTVGVIGFQWNWTFAYEGVTGADGSQLQVTGVPGQPAELLLPTNRTIRFVETSNDVIHSFWVPQFLFKRDVVPGRTNQFEVTIRKEGRYIGRCAELCGEKHSRMNFYVKVVSPEKYDAFIASQKSGSTTPAPAAQPVGSSS